VAKKIAVIVGSLRQQAWSKKLALALMKLAPASLSLEIVEIGDLPLYNQDYDDENKAPQAYTTFREYIKKVDGILFVTPEYNRSVPGLLKNAIDVGSRPYGKSVWQAKPAAVVSNSPSAIGGFGANLALRQTFIFLDVFCMPAPEAYIGLVNTLFDAEGNLTKEDTREYLKKFMDIFAKWVDRKWDGL
jgi:chromate reductase